MTWSFSFCARVVAAADANSPPGVRAQVLARAARRTPISRRLRGSVGPQFVGDDRRRRKGWHLSSFRIKRKAAVLLRRGWTGFSKDLAFSFYGAPHKQSPSPGDGDHHLIEMPSVVGFRPGLPQVPGDLGTRSGTEAGGSFRC